MEPKVRLITERRANEIVLEWERDPDKNRGLFLANSKVGTYIAIDNSDGNCWTEEFRTITGAVAWLLSED